MNEPIQTLFGEGLKRFDSNKIANRIRKMGLTSTRITAEPGDQIFFGDTASTWHTGIVTAVSGGYVYTEEGNAGSPSAVRSCKYPLNYKTIKGYGRPDWSLVPEDKPITEEKEDDDMKYYATLADVPSWYKDAIQALVNKGALKGTGNGELNVSEDFCRVMTVLYRLGKLG